MTFRSPEALLALLLIPAVVAAYIRSRRRRGRRSASLAAQGLVTTDAGRPASLRRHLPFALFIVALTLLVVSVARPIATISTPRRQATVVLALDVSNSMAATDVRPSRIGAAKAAAEAFVRRQPSAVRVGVVAFGQSSLIVQPPTSAHSEVLQAINRLSIGGGTSLGQGILTSLDAISGRTLIVNEAALGTDTGEVHIGYYGGSTIVLLSDGEDNNKTAPVSMARLASVAGVRIDTVGVGTAAGTTVQVEGFTLATALDSATLENVAKVANGSYHQGDSAAALSAISKTIDLHFTVVKQRTEISAIFSAAAVFFLLAGALISVLWFGRVI